MGPTWVLSAPDGPRVGPIDLFYGNKFIASNTLMPSKDVHVVVWCLIPLYGTLWYSWPSTDECYPNFKHMNGIITAIGPHIARFHGANIGPTWGRQHPGGPRVGPMKFAIRVSITTTIVLKVLSQCELQLDSSAPIGWRKRHVALVQGP